jgi:hypothetical protein
MFKAKPSILKVKINHRKEGEKMVKRKVYDEKLVMEIAILNVEREHPDWAKEHVLDVANTKEEIHKAKLGLTVLDFRDRLIQEYDGHRNVLQCHEEAAYLLHHMPAELIVNVNEYLDEQPLTDIKINGVSINDVFKMFENSRPLHFVQILRCMAYWRDGDYIDPDFCWNFFARA